MKRSFEEQLIPVQSHAHYILSMPEGDGPFPIFMTFHGLSGRAKTNIPDALKIPGIENWAVIAVESPHLYYTGGKDDNGDRSVGGCWVTTDNPEINIPDIAQYISTIIYNVQEDYPVDTKKVVYMGFSQGTIPAWASAADGVFKPAGVIAVGYHMYSRLYTDMLKGLPKALLGRGTKDPHYSEEKMNSDIKTLEQLAVNVTTCVYDAGHDWHPDFFEAAGRWLSEL